MFRELWKHLGQVGNGLTRLAGATRNREVAAADAARRERFGDVTAQTLRASELAAELKVRAQEVERG